MRDIFSSQINTKMLNTPIDAMLTLNNLSKDFKPRMMKSVLINNQAGSPF